MNKNKTAIITISFVFVTWAAWLIPAIISVSTANYNTLKISLTQKNCSVQDCQYKRLNKENILYWLNFYEVKYPEVVLAQAILECGWEFNSERATKKNNIFGFQHSEKDTLEFGHWIGSIIYYKAWQDKYYKHGDYLQFIQDYQYAEDVNYISKLKWIINKNSNE